MDYKALVSALDQPHDAYLDTVMEVFNKYRNDIIQCAIEQRDALIENDANHARFIEIEEQQLNDSIGGIEDEAEPIVIAARKRYEEMMERGQRNRDETAASIRKASARRDALSWEWLNTQLSVARHEFNIQLIGAIADNLD